MSVDEAARGMAAAFATMISGGKLRVPPPPPIETIQAALRGKSLACWCGLCERHYLGKPLGECSHCAPCHGDVLIELANR